MASTTTTMPGVIVSETNRYGDILLKVPNNMGNLEEHYFLEQEIVYDPKQGYIVHLEVSDETVPLIPEDFRFITVRKIDGFKKAIYANECVINKCPKIIDDAVTGAVVVLTVSLDTNPGTLNVVFVKDRTKDKLTNPAGTMDNNETHIQCAIRECYEETGIRLNKDLRQIGSLEYIANVFEIKWPGTGIIYYTHAILTETEMNALVNFSCDEIEKVYVYPVTSDAGVDITEIDGIPISKHHQVAANHAISKITGKKYDWRSESLNYLKDFRLF